MAKTAFFRQKSGSEWFSTLYGSGTVESGRQPHSKAATVQERPSGNQARLLVSKGGRASNSLLHPRGRSTPIFQNKLIEFNFYHQMR